MINLFIYLFFYKILSVVGGQILGRVLSEFYKSVEKLGFVAGGEFKAAVEEGVCVRLNGGRSFMMMKLISIDIDVNYITTS